MALPFSALLPVLGKVLDRVLPDKAQRDEAERQLLVLQQAGDLKQIETQLSAIIAESNSADPWTSRARPSFLYVVYIIILAGIPMGFVHSINPEMASSFSTGFSNHLHSLPSEMWTLFGVGYLGYTGARTLDKRK